MTGCSLCYILLALRGLDFHFSRISVWIKKPPHSAILVYSCLSASLLFRAVHAWNVHKCGTCHTEINFEHLFYNLRTHMRQMGKLSYTSL